MKDIYRLIIEKRILADQSSVFNNDYSTSAVLWKQAQKADL